MKQIDFFMGANSPDGFFSLYSELSEPVKAKRSFLIKGGAGTGKSSVMKKVADSFGEKESLTELIHCSSDPDSLDGVILHDGGCSVIDATLPHAVEPRFPGGFQTVVNLCEYFDEKKLNSRLPLIVELQNENTDCHRKCRGLLKCADILLKDNMRLAEEYTDFDKINTQALRICKKELPKTNRNGIEHKRLLSAVTNKGVLCFSQTASALCDRIYLLRDEYGASSSAMLNIIRLYALSNGYEIFCCYCPLTPKSKPEHIFIPALSLGFVTENRYNDMSSITPYKVINYTRFTNTDELRKKKNYLSFNKKAAAEIINAAVSVLANAKTLHDELEKQYTDAVDFSRVDEKTSELLSAIKERYSGNLS